MSQCYALYRYHWTKFLLVFDNFSTTFWQPKLRLASVNAGAVRGGVVNCREANTVLVNLAFHSPHILIGQFKRKPPESCQNDVTKLSQTNQKLCQSGNDSMRSIEKKSAISRPIERFPVNIFYCRFPAVYFIVKKERNCIDALYFSANIVWIYGISWIMIEMFIQFISGSIIVEYCLYRLLNGVFTRRIEFY